MATIETTCRRCTECVGQEHHWMENYDFDEDGDPEWTCKHCDAYCHDVDGEDADGDEIHGPSGVLVEWHPRGDEDEPRESADLETKLDHLMREGGDA